MSRNGSGVYTWPAGSFNPAVDGASATASDWNTDRADLEAAITASIAVDGQTPATAALPMATFNHTNVGNATARNHYAAAGQVQDNSLRYATDTGAADAYVITLSPAITSYVVGQRFSFKAANANLTTTPTLVVNGLTAGVIKNIDSSAVGAGVIPANGIIEVAVQAVAAGTPTFHIQSGTVVGFATTAYADSEGVRQVVKTITSTVATGTTAIPYDNTIPQKTEGDQYMTCAITPKSATSTLKITVVWNGTVNGFTTLIMALFQDSTSNALSAVAAASGDAAGVLAVPTQLVLVHEMVSGTTSATTFKVRVGTTIGGLTVAFNGDSSATQLFGGVMGSNMTIEEIGS